MANLSEIISQAKQQVVQNAKLSTQAAIDTVKQTAAGVLSSAKNEVVNRTSQAVSGAINAGITGVVGAASSAITGNFGEAAQRIFDIPGAAAGAVGAVLGVSSGSMLSSPGMGFSASSNMGISEGNALYGMLARPDPLLSINWYAQLPVLNSPLGTVGLPWFYVEQATLPFRTTDTVSVYRAGHNVHFAGRYSVDNLTLGVYMDSGGNALKYLQYWEACKIAPTNMSNYATGSGGFLVPSMYKKPIYVYLLDPARLEIAIVQYVGCWPTNLDSLQLDSESSTRLVANVNFSVDDVFVVSTGVSALSMQSILEAANPIPQILQSVTSGVIQSTQRIVNSAVGSVKQAIGNSVKGFF